MKKSQWVLGILGTIVAVAAVAVALNYMVVRDFLLGASHQPSTEMAEIRSKLDLTGAGMRIFNAVRPELQERAEFNENCRDIETTTAVLGCYRDERIFIYNITSSELAGIRELTTAHELLHAVYQRLSDADKTKWGEELKAVLVDNAELKAEIEIYDADQQAEELYVRAGTEVKNLPSALEEHYAEIFADQDKVVGFYESYIKVFNETREKVAQLMGQIESKAAEIESKTAEYEAGVEALNAQVAEFNACAAELDCFSSSWAFNTRRAELVTEQARLSGLYDEVNGLISEYNKMVTEYNENILHGRVLNQAINSSEKVEDL